MQLEIKVQGLEELFKKLGKATAQETLETGLNQGAYLLQGWSQKNRLSGPRPQYLGVVTGRLRSSLSVSRSIKRGEFKFFVGTNVKYAPTHEFGDMSRNIPARPFLRPSIENKENVNKITEIINKRIREALEK